MTPTRPPLPLRLLPACGLVLLGGLAIYSSASAAHPHAAEKKTTLTDPAVPFEVVASGAVRLKRGPIELVLVDNQAHRLDDAPNHRAGYNGIAVLKHERRPRTLFVPEVAGLNFEHIHDGTTAGLVEKFEPRKFPLQLRRIDEFTYELHQPPTENFELESCGRYRLMPDGTIEYAFECVPRADRFRRKFIALFWASYIHQPEDKSIHFIGRPAAAAESDAASTVAPGWINGVTPEHGVDATHPPAGKVFLPQVDADFPLRLVHGRSRYVHTGDWYYGVCRGMAWVQVFRPRDRIWIAQSPSGGGNGNPAWDFQWFVPEVRTGESYGFVMRAAYVPYESPDQIRRLAEQIQSKM